PLTRLYGADPVRPSQDLRVDSRGRNEGAHGALAERDAEGHLLRVLAMRHHGNVGGQADGEAGGQRVLEGLELAVAQPASALPLGLRYLRVVRHDLADV